LILIVPRIILKQDAPKFGNARAVSFVFAFRLSLDPSVGFRRKPGMQSSAAIMTELARITGMKLHHPVPCALITKDDVNKFLKIV